MKSITDEEYDEFLRLQKIFSKQTILDSAKSITKLEDDIDAPIKKCVAMFALLECVPIYSCCGFDYDGQPIHKSHQYGRPYLILTVNPATTAFLDFLYKQKTLWFASRGNHPKWVNLELVCDMNPHWRKEECIHFYEECLVGISRLESVLLKLQSYMIDQIEIVDTNYLAKKQVKYWQYPPKEPWTVKKELIGTY